MSELDKLRTAFHDDCHFLLTELVEEFEDGSAMRRRICDGGYQYFVVRLETQRTKSWYPFFRKGHELSKICDYIIFVELSDRLYALLVEMKLGEECPRLQLEYSANFVKFVLRRMMLNSILALDKPVYMRKIGITDNTTPKNLTKIIKDPSSTFDEDNYIKRYKGNLFMIKTFVSWPTKSRDKGLINLDL